MKRNDRLVENFAKDFDLWGYLERHGVEKLSVSGVNIMGCCPFHEEDTPSWGINRYNFLYNCFACHAQGNLITLMKHFGDNSLEIFKDGYVAPTDVSELERLEGELLQMLEEKEEEKPLLFSFPKNVYESDSKEFKQLLYSLVFADRGISVATCKRYNLVIGRSGRWQMRALIPIFDHEGNYRFFAGRKIEKKGSRIKWLYPKGCDRASVIFNLRRVLNIGEAVVVEGIFDVMKLDQLGIPVVSLLSSQVSQKQVALLSRLDSVVLMFDGDFPGKIATNVVGQILFDKGIEVKVVYLPAQKDPDQLSEVQVFDFVKNAKKIIAINKKKIVLEP